MLEPIDFGIASAGEQPVFVTYRRSDTGAELLPRPALAIVDAAGLSSFDQGWDLVASDVEGITWKAVTPSGVEIFGVVVRSSSYGSALAAAPGALNLAALRDAVRDAVMEKVTDLGLIPSDASLDRYINAANRAIFKEAAAWNPRPWFERSADIAYASPLPFSSLTPDSAPVRSVHLVRVKVANGYAPVTPLEEGELDFAEIEAGGAANPVLSQNAIASRWFVEGQAIWLTPPPAGATVLGVSLVRAIGSMTDAVNHYALGGQLPDHHDLVVWKTAQLLYWKDEVLRTPWDAEIAEGLRALRKELARNQGQRTRRIRRASHFPNTRRR
jgi:hypothetical protein